MRIVITFGTFDVFHIGHLNILRRAKELGDFLCVGVSSDALNYAKKGRLAIYPETERMEIVAALKCVDDVFLEHSLELKRSYIEFYRADVLVMGRDWEGKFNEFSDICEVVYLERTPAMSTSGLIQAIKKYE